jgi:parallel beta-helix repeat protein
MAIATPRRLAFGCLAAFTLLAIGCADRAPLEPDAAHPLAAAVGGAHVVHVAPPTGNRDLDRASILAALGEVRPGGTVQFAEGTYLIGFDTPFSLDFIRVTVPRITLLGHPAGTTLRGCNPEDFVFVGCNGLELTGGHQTVRDLTFEYSWFALFLGREFSVDPDGNFFFDPIESGPGGYRIENNTFRNIISVTMYGRLREPSLIRHNTFTNVWHAVVVRGGTAHVLDNDISAPDPEQVPFFGYPGGSAIAIVPNYHASASSCDHNIVANNRIETYPNGIVVRIPSPGEVPTVTATCRHNIVRDNTVVNSRIFHPDFDEAALSLQNHLGPEGFLEHNLVEGNRILGAEGMGIMVYRAERNRIVNNAISGITLRDPFPGWLGEGNGSGVWVSPGSSGNKLLANTFADLAAHAAVLEGDDNHVATTSASDVVRDLGVGNRVTGPGSVVTTAAAVGASVLGAPRVMERAEAERRLRERTGARARGLEEVRREAAREAAPR